MGMNAVLLELKAPPDRGDRATPISSKGGGYDTIEQFIRPDRTRERDAVTIGRAAVRAHNRGDIFYLFGGRDYSGRAGQHGLDQAGVFGSEKDDRGVGIDFIGSGRDCRPELGCRLSGQEQMSRRESSGGRSTTPRLTPTPRVVSDESVH
jgi:hypothetical protein